MKSETFSNLLLQFFILFEKNWKKNQSYIVILQYFFLSIINDNEVYPMEISWNFYQFKKNHFPPIFFFFNSKNERIRNQCLKNLDWSINWDRLSCSKNSFFFEKYFQIFRYFTWIIDWSIFIYKYHQSWYFCPGLRDYFFFLSYLKSPCLVYLSIFISIFFHTI